VFVEDVRVPGKKSSAKRPRLVRRHDPARFRTVGLRTTAARSNPGNLVKGLHEGERPGGTQSTRIARPGVANNVARFLGYRIGYIQASGMVTNYEASVVKIFQSELGQKIYNFGVNQLGLSGQMLPEEPKAPFGGDMPESYIQAVPSSIYSGSNEIQRNIIATRGLGLPRG